MRGLFIVILCMLGLLTTGCESKIEQEIIFEDELIEIKQPDIINDEQESIEESTTTDNRGTIVVETVEFDWDNTVAVLEAAFERPRREAEFAANRLRIVGIRGAISAELLEYDPLRDVSTRFVIIESEDNIIYRLRIAFENRQIYVVDEITEEETGFIIWHSCYE